jgi:zinc protease
MAFLDPAFLDPAVQPLFVIIMHLSSRMSGFIALLFVLSALMASILPNQLTAASEAWPQVSSDIPADASVTYGVLDNGLRYAIMRNAEPPQRVSLRLYVNAGSLMEKEDQRGLAHFIEHMAFNGTKHHEAGGMVEYFQRLGMGFGNDTNAHTSWDETVYKLELPNSSSAMMDDGMQMLRDYADGLLFDPKEIDDERGIILAEKRDRDSVGYRMFVDALKFSLPESLIPERMTIGEESVISNAKRDNFLAYYNKWYTADRMVVLVVGDIDPDKALVFIKKYFLDLPEPALRLKNPDMGKIRPRGTVAKVLREPEAPAVDVSISTLRELAPTVDSVADRGNRLSLTVANAIVNRRLAILAKEEGAPFTEGSIYNFRWLRFVECSEINLTCPPDKWKDAVAVCEQELRRALLHGFTKSELSEAVANMRNGYEEAVRRAKTRKSQDIVDNMVGCLGDWLVYSSPEKDLEIASATLDALTPEKALEAFRTSWAGDTRIIYASGNLPENATDLQAREAYRDSMGKSVEAPAAKESAEFAYQDFGKATKVESAHDIMDLDVTQLRFSNNVCLNVRPSDTEKNVIRVYVRFGGGLLEAPKDKPGLGIFASMTFIGGGLEKHSADDLARIFAGRNVGVSFSVEPDSFVLQGATTRRDLQDELNLLAAFLTAPGYREESVRLAKKNIPQMYLSLRHTPEGVMNNEVSSFMARGDFRFGFPEESVLESRTMEEVKEWLAKPLAEGRLEISIAGDLAVDEVIPMVTRTFGALPKRDAAKPGYTEARNVSLPAPQVKVFEYETQLPKATLLTAWPTDDQWNIGKARRLMLLAEILSDRLRVNLREKLGEAYSPYAMNVPSDTFRHYGYTTCIVELSPDKVEKASALIRTVCDDMAKNGMTQDEFERALKPTLEEVTQLRRNNHYWLYRVLSSSQEYPVRLEWARSMVSDLQSITLEELNALAAEYLKSDRLIDVRVMPKAAAAPAPAKAE